MARLCAPPAIVKTAASGRGGNMLGIVRRFETAINVALLVMMSLVVVLTTIDLGWTLVEHLISPPYVRFSDEALKEVFSGFLLVLIGLELLDTVRAYMTEKAVRIELVLAVGLVAITRKMIVIDIKDLDSLWLIGIAAVIVALAVGYYIITSARQRAATKPGPST
jgi:uncharacterized membrane protein (DUF373 family)